MQPHSVCHGQPLAFGRPTLTPPGQRAAALAFALGVGSLLAVGFIPVSQSLAQWLLTLGFPDPFDRWVEPLSLVALAGLFHFSLRPSLPKASRLWLGWKSLGLPIALAALWAPPTPSLTAHALVITAVLSPIAEEWLFRGWLFGIAQRSWPQRVATWTNPLPLSVWVTAIAFSLWHAQNIFVAPPGWVALQMAYTLPLGLWLGWLRSRTGSTLLPILAHAALNFSGCVAR